MTEPFPLPRVRVVVLNWNSAWYSRRCLRSLQRTDYPADRLEIVLVDNGSVDGSLEQLRHWFPDVTVIENGENLGFAEGCNRAMRNLGDIAYVALVNNDAVVEPGWLRPLVDALELDPVAGAAAAKLLLEPEFVAVDVDLVNAEPDPVGERHVDIASVELDGLDVTDRLRHDGLHLHHDQAWPLLVTRRIDGPARIWVPATERSKQIRLVLAGPGEVAVAIPDEAGPRERTVTSPGEVTFDVPAQRTTLVNGLGTALTDGGEGYDRYFAQPDGDDLVGGPVRGFSGGGVLLRREMLAEIGLFDPRFFAYYEDTDLAWRARRGGWGTVAVPESVIHHAYGASGGHRAKGFFFLDRRNWMLTAFRNGDQDLAYVVRNRAREQLVRAFRQNVFGKVRRLQKPSFELFVAWVRIRLAVALAARRTRRDMVPGRRTTGHVRSRLQPVGAPGAPAPRPGGPLIVYIEVTDTLRSGWRAGIQRVVSGFAANLGDVDDRIEVVLLTRCRSRVGVRRVSSEERERLLEPTMERPDPPPAEVEVVPPTGVRKVVGNVRRTVMARADRTGLGDRFRQGQRRIVGRSSAELDTLLFVEPQPGTVLFEVDAVWNQGDVERREWLTAMADRGVHVVPYVHDLLPIERPEWFVEELVESFRETVVDQLGHADLVVANSRASAESAARVARSAGADRGRGSPHGTSRSGGTEYAVVVPGADLPTPPGPLPEQLDGVRFVLTPGTIEPRKNQALVLDVFDQLVERLPDINLVLVGRAGWGIDELVERLQSHPSLGARVHWMQGASDATLSALYRSAEAVVVPSLFEGYGLPVVESLSHGTPVLCSAGGALAEVGGEHVELFDPTDPRDLATKLEAMLSDPAAMQAARKRAADFEATTWADSSRELANLLVDRFGSP